MLKLPVLGSFLRSRWGRLSVQLALLLVAALLVYDGLTGPQLAPRNTATVLSWVHFRGLLILGLLLVGNVFCFACPFALPRSIALRLSSAGFRWPKRLRNKWISVSTLLLIFWLYEWLDLWASPWLTAWIVVAYFAASFILEAAFSESAFCKYVCPLGAFNFTLSTSSPLQIQAKNQTVCLDCVGKECVNGASNVLGCGTELFVPTIKSNMDCTFCLDCARACPYDNVQLATRRPLGELISSSWPARWDVSFLAFAVAFLGLWNAFGMVPPVYTLDRWISQALSIDAEGVRLLIIFTLGALVLPGLLLLISTSISHKIGAGNRKRRVETAAAYAPAIVPLGLGIWLAHYGFHLAIGGLTIVPVLQAFLLDHGVSILGSNPDWSLGFLMPLAWIFPIQILSIMVGFLASLSVLSKIAFKQSIQPVLALKEILPWSLVFLGLTISVLYVFGLPMEMRGTILLTVP